MVDFQVGSGALQGDGMAAQLFVEVYNPCLDRVRSRLAELEPPGMFVKWDVVNNQSVDVSLSSYADDVANKLTGHSALDMADKNADINAALDRELGSAGLAQNRDKQEHVPLFAGPGTREQYKTIFRNNMLAGKVCRDARYLGSRYDMHGSLREELQRRVAAAQLGWVTFGRFWSRSSAAKRAKLTLFQSMVHTSLLSGLECFVLQKGDYEKLDRVLLKFARKLMCACIKSTDDNGVLQYKAVPNKHVYRYVRLVPSKDELLVRRLRWYQQLARRPDLRTIWFACLFGSFEFEQMLTLQHDGIIHVKANPWAQQFANDILVQLSQFEDGATLVSFLENQPLRVFTDFRHEFLRLDVSPIRQKHFTSAIPPPEYVPQPDASADEAEGYIQEDEPVFRCDCLCEDGRPCTAVFKTRQQLSVHVRSTKGGTHAEVPRYRKLAIANQYPFCRKLFSSKRTAQQHIRRSLDKQVCTGSGSATVFEPEVPGALKCPHCAVEFATLPELWDHVPQHVPRPRVPEAR